MKKEYIAPLTETLNVIDTPLLAETTISYGGGNKDTSGGKNPPPKVAESKDYEWDDTNWDDNTQDNIWDY